MLGLQKYVDTHNAARPPTLASTLRAHNKGPNQDQQVPHDQLFLPLERYGALKSELENF